MPLFKSIDNLLIELIDTLWNVNYTSEETVYYKKN